jgi:iron complex outermembrane receptor protein
MNALYSSSLGATAFRVDLRDEAIYSNLLGTEAGAVGGPFEGDSIYSRADHRLTNEVALSHRIESGRFATTINVSVIGMDSMTFVLPGADLTMRLDSDGDVLLFGSVNRSVRQPSFTDLYYNLGGAQGSIYLVPELSDNFETGVRANMALSETTSLMFEQTAFIRQGHNLIDWVRYEGSLTTQAANLREVTFNGMETSLLLRERYNDSFGVSFGVSYTFIKADESSDGFESNYVLDFLRHKLDIRTSLSLPADLKLSFRYSLQDREGGYYSPVEGEEVEFLPVGLLGATLSREFMEGKLRANIRVDNALDEEYVDIGNVMLPGRWMRASLTFVFN